MKLEKLPKQMHHKQKNNTENLRQKKVERSMKKEASLVIRLFLPYTRKGREVLQLNPYE